MNAKQLILVLIVIILVIIGAITIKKVREYTQKNITIADECAKDEDCGYSSITCKNDLNVNCKNGCVFGKCTKCVPFCPGESECDNVTCRDSIRICPDGKRVRCANYCDLDKGKCGSCIPECNITVTEDINYQLKKGEFILDAVPCVEGNYTEKTRIESIKKNLTDIRLPEGYSIAIEPFSVNCDGSLNLTLNIPETFSDVKALRCREQDCNVAEVNYVTKLRCGGKISKEFLRESRYLEPRLMPIKIKEVRFNVTSDMEIWNDKYKVRFDGNFENLDVTLSMPKEAVEEAINPSLRISGTPLVIKIKGKIEENVNSTVTMPYINLEGFEEDSIGMYVKINKGWDYIGGEINKEDNTVMATIINASNYLDEGNEIKVALMAVLCISCYGSSLTKVYQPEKGSTDAVILIHGFNPDPDTYKPLIDEIRLTNQPFDVWTFNYPWSRPVRENMGELMSILEKNHANYKNAYIVAHSLGGLIAQEALYNSYLENKKSLENKQPLKYGYLSKVREVILAGAPNDGSPVVEVYRNLFKSLINEGGKILFNPNNPVINDMVKGVITPRVPGIDYKVIAGTKSYGFNLLFFEVTTGKLAGMYEENDGVITVKSAQHIGDGYINNKCKNYWELNLTHTELVDDALARRIIGRIISEDISEKDTAVLGRNKYFNLVIEDCSAEDKYIIIGKKIKEERALDETGCSCGNGYCGEGENEINCPSDCARFLSKENRTKIFIFLTLIIVSFSISLLGVNRRRFSHPHLKRMIGHIKNYYDIVPGEGYTHEQIRKSFLNRGWPKRIVEDSINLLNKEFHDTYHKPLKKHFKKHLRKGYTKEQIKRALVDSGWKEELIEKVIRGEELKPSFRPKEGRREGYKDRFEGKRRFFGWNRKT